jgi:general secretion pathway protein I
MKMVSKSRGFTLVEVMVALLIVALALPALLMRIGGMATAAGHSRETALAYWVAENKLQEIYLTQRLQGIVPRGRQADDTQMAGETWDWQTETEETEFPGILRLRIRVRAQGAEENLVELSGFLLE